MPVIMPGSIESGLPGCGYGLRPLIIIQKQLLRQQFPAAACEGRPPRCRRTPVYGADAAGGDLSAASSAGSGVSGPAAGQPRSAASIARRVIRSSVAGCVRMNVGTPSAAFVRARACILAKKASAPAT
jgi:hypothetical protein